MAIVVPGSSGPVPVVGLRNWNKCQLVHCGEPFREFDGCTFSNDKPLAAECSGGEGRIICFFISGGNRHAASWRRVPEGLPGGTVQAVTGW